VVRLKSGDPFVLGRGGEEALALVDAGIPFEVIPGVSSVVAAPGLAGIPLTHRGWPRASWWCRAHRGGLRRGAGRAAPGSVTVVVLMGLGARGRIAARLIARGWDPATPAAIVAARPPRGLALAGAAATAGRGGAPARRRARAAGDRRGGGAGARAAGAVRAAGARAQGAGCG
jgi:hypothetical protein